eukprot:TRINITY_DN40097_c0_g1_i1.p1 TRINITY_DN40097_c0_g1~~TRINITY_DN40097_c0_g1_i1.p1  ORF type:complete len:131 (+),score=40.31 TRINITY_DN40097_c0_g1_i1:161-553(+)
MCIRDSLGGDGEEEDVDDTTILKKRPNNITLLNSLFGVMMRKIRQLDDVGGSLRQQSSHQVGTLRNFEHEAHDIRQRNRRLEQQLLDAINEKLALQNLLQAVSYTHLRAHETPEHLVCRLLLEKKKKKKK